MDMIAPLETALTQIREGDIAQARATVQLEDGGVSDDDFLEAMMSAEEGLNQLRMGKHSAAAEPIERAYQVLQNTTDSEFRVGLFAAARFLTGIRLLLQGDSFGAAKNLNASNEIFKKVGFFSTDIKKLSLSGSAASNMAMAKSSMNAGDLSNAELWLSKARADHDELLSLLDVNDPSDLDGFAEIYGSRVEVSLLHALMDLQAFDFRSMQRRLDSSAADVKELAVFVKRMPPGQLRGACDVILILHSVMNRIQTLGTEILIKRSPASKTMLQDFEAIGSELFEARKTAQNSGDRGRVFLFVINVLTRVQQNILSSAKVRRQDFGKYAGVVSFLSLIILVVVVHLTVKPSGTMALVYFLGELIIALIVGFGYGALKFQPLLKLYSSVAKSGDGGQK